MALLDVKDYIQTKERALADYEDRAAWAKKMLVNIAKAGYFSSDRSVAEYERDIWKLRPVPGCQFAPRGGELRLRLCEPLEHVRAGGRAKRA